MNTEAQATRWLVRLDATRSPELIAEHAQWMAESARNRVAYMKASLAWKRMDALRRMRPLDSPGEVDPDLMKTPRPTLWSDARTLFGALRAAWRPRFAAGVGLSLAAAFR